MWLSLTEAAAYIGYKPGGLRKLVRRRDIRFYQVRKHSPLRFRREWLDQFIEAHSNHPGVSRGLSSAPRKKKTPPVAGEVEKTEFGFDSALLNL